MSTPSPAPHALPPVRISASAPVSLGEIVAIADGATVTLAPEVAEALVHGQEAAERISAARPTYGRSTGVGANRTTAVTEAEAHGRMLVRSHATDAGDPLPRRVVRATAATRLVQLRRARSGIDPAVAHALQRMLNADALPEVGSAGSIGTGDLAALSAIALALAGERPTTPPLEGEPIAWGADSALPFLSSNALTVGRSALAAAELRRLDRAGRVLYAVALVAFEGSAEAFSVPAASAIAAPGADVVAGEIRALLEGHAAAPARIQDPYGLRVYPVIQALVVTALERLESQLSRLANAAQENPVFDAAAGTVTHHGGFYQAQLAADLDAMNLAIAQSAASSHARLRLANEPAYTGLRPFLAEGPDGASGLMMLEYTAAGALAEIRASAAPASLGTVVLSRGAEEDASFASQGAVQLERAIAAHRTVLACEALALGRLLRQREVAAPPRLHDAADRLRALQPSHEDQDLRPPLTAAAALLDELGDVIAAG
ncbi:aromatic amino acid lyase [Microbacterium sp. MEC084]|uniref:aromatic amino acid ammonia-lyase n=1 Tax=Microbacterium sp. MEC084 TaxID=1963027 RepID=UPI00106F6551|nr:aromatic amino acid ammonia-lyase [Microbacterium sp. MEC084]MCD1268014.1 aromatic amino acid lyase [Microbacterium sp. MEC084]